MLPMYQHKIVLKRVFWSNPAIMIATRCFFVVPLAVGWLALSPMAEAQLPSPTQIDALAATVQKVSEQIEMNEPARRLVTNP